MFLVQQITASPLQTMTLILADGSKLGLTLYYRPMQLGWYLEQVTWGTFTAGCLRIVNSPNLLHQFCNQLPFGLACYTTGNREPTQQQDFLSGAAKLYVISQAEVTQFTEYLHGAANYGAGATT